MHKICFYSPISKNMADLSRYSPLDDKTPPTHTHPYSFIRNLRPREVLRLVHNGDKISPGQATNCQRAGRQIIARPGDNLLPLTATNCRQCGRAMINLPLSIAGAVLGKNIWGTWPLIIWEATTSRTTVSNCPVAY